MLELILGVVFIIYILFIGQLIYGFNRVKRFTKNDTIPTTSFSIVVPFRNEAENLPKLLHTISNLNYPKELFEVLLVDDESEEVFNSGVTSRRSSPLTSPARTPPWIAAPIATHSSGLMPLKGSMPVYFLTAS